MSGQVNYIKLTTVSGEVHNTYFESEVSGKQLDSELYNQFLKPNSYIKLGIDDKTTRYIKTEKIESMEFIERDENEDDSQEIEEIPITWIDNT